MPEGWEIGVFVHIVAVFVLGGAVALSLTTYTMMRHAPTVQAIRVWAGLGRVMGQYQVLPVTALVLILSGAYLVDKLNREWDEGWIGFSAIAVVLAVLVGLFVISPRMKAVGMAAGPAPDGPVPDEITGRLNDPVLYGASHANAMTAIAIIWNMTVKPDDLAALLVLLVLAGLGAASGLTRTMGKPQPVASSTDR